MNITDVSSLLSVALTGIYVLATWKILKANKESADAAREQIFESEKMRQLTIDVQRQNVDLQLFERRYHIYVKAQSLFLAGKIVCENESYSITLKMFGAYLLRNSENKVTMELWEEFDKLENQRKTNQNNDLVSRQKSLLLRRIQVTAFYYLSAELETMMLAKHCFNYLDNTKIDDFCTSMKNLASHIEEETIRAKNNEMCNYANAVKKVVMALEDSQFIEKMENQLNIRYIE